MDSWWQWSCNYTVNLKLCDIFPWIEAYFFQEILIVHFYSYVFPFPKCCSRPVSWLLSDSPQLETLSHIVCSHWREDGHSFLGFSISPLLPQASLPAMAFLLIHRRYLDHLPTLFLLLIIENIRNVFGKSKLNFNILLCLWLMMLWSRLGKLTILVICLSLGKLGVSGIMCLFDGLSGRIQCRRNRSASNFFRFKSSENMKTPVSCVTSGLVVLVIWHLVLYVFRFFYASQF